MLTVVQVIPVPGVIDINVVVLVPNVRPVFRPRVHNAEPIAAVLESWVPTRKHYRKAVDAEPVIPAEGATETVIGNAIAPVAATLLPSAMFGIPSAGAVLQPHIAPVVWLHEVDIDTDGDAILRISPVVQVIAVPEVVHIHIIVFVPVC
jgi:hypothetical protein